MDSAMLNEFREAALRKRGADGVGNGNRTRNRRSHSPVLCQLSYSHRRTLIIQGIVPSVEPMSSMQGHSRASLGSTPASNFAKNSDFRFQTSEAKAPFYSRFSRGAKAPLFHGTLGDSKPKFYQERPRAGQCDSEICGIGGRTTVRSALNVTRKGEPGRQQRVAGLTWKFSVGICDLAAANADVFKAESA